MEPVLGKHLPESFPSDICTPFLVCMSINEITLQNGFVCNHKVGLGHNISSNIVDEHSLFGKNIVDCLQIFSIRCEKVKLAPGKGFAMLQLGLRLFWPNNLCVGKPLDHIGQGESVGRTGENDPLNSATLCQPLCHLLLNLHWGKEHQPS